MVFQLSLNTLQSSQQKTNFEIFSWYRWSSSVYSNHIDFPQRFLHSTDDIFHRSFIMKKMSNISASNSWKKQRHCCTVHSENKIRIFPSVTTDLFFSIMFWSSERREIWSHPTHWSRTSIKHKHLLVKFSSMIFSKSIKQSCLCLIEFQY